jgi:PAS domain S-box-containing protein
LELEIAEHQKAEERLTDNEARYRALFDGVPDALLVADIVTGIIRDVNQSTCRLFARTRDELVGVHQSTLHPPRLARETEQTFREYSHEAAEGKAGAPFEHVILRADGSEIPIEIRTQPVMLDGAQMMLGVFRDISERKRAEMVTRARLRMLEAVYAAGVSLEDTLRLMLDEIEAQTVSRIGFYHFLEEDQQTLSLQNWSTNTLSTICTAEGKVSHYPVVQAGVWADSVRERRAVIHNDYASLRNHKGVPDGHATIVRELTVPIFRGSRIVAIIGVGNKADDYTDNDVQTVSLLGDFSWEIVERKMAEEKLRCLNEELEQRVKERTSELAARNADLEKMNKVFVGRELKMVELKERIRELEGSSEKRGDQNARQ